MFFPYFALIPSTSYCGNADCTFLTLHFLRSALFAQIRTGMFLACKFPMIVTFTCEYGSCVPSRTTNTVSTSSSHLMLSMTPFVASRALFLAFAADIPDFMKSS